MSKIILELDSCRGCPFHYSTPYPTDDSYERPEYFWCTNPDVEEENPAQSSEGERSRIFIKQDRGYNKLSYVRGYVEWRDNVEIPNWCPIKVKE